MRFALSNSLINSAGGIRSSPHHELNSFYFANICVSLLFIWMCGHNSERCTRTHTHGPPPKHNRPKKIFASLLKHLLGNYTLHAPVRIFCPVRLIVYSRMYYMLVFVFVNISVPIILSRLGMLISEIVEEEFASHSYGFIFIYPWKF